MAKAFRLFTLLLWKNLKLQQRKPVVTFFEIALPPLFALGLVLVRHLVTATNHPEGKEYKDFRALNLPTSLCPLKPACMEPFVSLFPWWLYYSPSNNFTDAVMQKVKDRTERIDNVVGFDNETALVKDLVKCLSKRPKPLEPDFMENGKPDIENTCIVLGGIVFTKYPNKINGTRTKIKYKIRLRYSWSGEDFGDINDLMSSVQNTWKTTKMYPVFQTNGPRSTNASTGGPPNYFKDGFLTLQQQVDHAIIEVYGNVTIKSPIDEENMTCNGNISNDGTISSGENISCHGNESVDGNLTTPFPHRYPIHMKRFPYPPWNDDPFIFVIQRQLPLLLMLSFVFYSLQIVKEVVHEKERKIKETLKILGVGNWIQWSSWFIKHVILMFICVCIITIFFVIPINDNGSVVGYTNPLIIMLFLFVYSLATITFSFLVSVFFSKANPAAAAGGVIFFMTYVPYFFIQQRYAQLSLTTKVVSCLLSNVAMAFGGQIIGMFEGTGSGIQWSNIDKGASIDDPFSMMHVIGMLLVDTVLYFVLAVYIENVFPGEFGVPRPFYYPFTKSYWCGNKAKEFDDSCSNFSESTSLLGSQRSDHQDPAYFENEPDGCIKGIQICSLRKVYSRGARPAVKDVTLNMYEGQITALLGHNGAGKTTTISMLTGFIPPTSGTAYVTGYDIRDSMDEIRENLGLCPQHDVLFDKMTVSEHLYFYARLKGVPKEDIWSEVELCLENINLTLKRNALTHTLSGGQKRKLSVGLALIGGSKIVILDEPTSGLDPNARRQIWDILNAHKRGRTVILTTHYMDEADILGDRIAIMANGSLKCCGSPLFLKHKYGAGYNLVIVKNMDCDVDKLTERVQHHINTAQLQSLVSAEVCYSLPYESKAHFEQLFIEIEENMLQYGINSFGVSVTTMEEVFIRVGEMTESESNPALTSLAGAQNHAETYASPDGVLSSPPAIPEPDSESELAVSCPSVNAQILHTDGRYIRKYRGFKFCLSQLYGLFVKRMLHTYRNLLLSISQLLIPVVFTIFGLAVLKSVPQAGEAPPLVLDMAKYGPNTVLFNESRTGDATHELAKYYTKQFRHFPDLDIVNTSTKTVEEYLIDMGTKSISSYNNDFNIATAFKSYYHGTSDLVVMFNNEAFHNTAISLAAAMNAFFAYVMKSDDVSIETTNHPLPRDAEQKISNSLIQSFQSFTITFCLLFGMSFLISSFAMFLIKERATKAKHVQFVSGVNAFSFWISTFVWDFINFFLPCIAIMITFAAFGIEAYVGGGRLGYITLLFVCYGFSGLPFTYLLSMLFTIPSTGLVWLTMINIFLGIGTVLGVDILSIPQLQLQNVAKGLEWTFLTFIPSFCLGQGLNQFYENYDYLKICESPMVKTGCNFNISNPCCKDTCGDFCLGYTENYISFEEGGIGRYLAFLAVQSIIFFSILFIIETRVLQLIWYKLSPKYQTVHVDPDEDTVVIEDSDVALERQRIAATDIRDLNCLDSLVLCDLTKCYNKATSLAVDRLSLGIPRQECFGLLGVNGAGKTTTFKMLTGDELVTSGDAYLAGFSVKDSISQVHCVLGYCPQYDALIDQLTGYETLVMFARLRGVKEINKIVTTLLTDLLLTEHAHKLVKNYSGGNKRKLSTAIALVGNPSIILLDEPSCGMDPVARRQLWDVLDKARSRGQTLVLTSHSMEECEALCTRLAIMVNGKLKCLGSTQHLKSKFGEGYTLVAKMHPDNTQPFMDMITITFPSSVLKDAHQGMLHYHITDTRIKWSELFAVMEKTKDKFQLDDYALSQTTLEQVFISFAQAQNPPIPRTITCLNQLTCGLC